MKMVLLLLLISCSALAQTQLKISEFIRTNTVNLTDDVIVNSTNANAATGYSTRRTSVSNLLGLVTSSIIDTNDFALANDKTHGLNRLWRFRSAIASSNRPISVVFIGDQNDFPGAGAFHTEMIKLGLPHEGGLGSGFGDVGSLRINTNGLVHQYSDPSNILPVNKQWWSVTNGAIITWDRIGAGTGVTDTNHYCDTFKFTYLKEPIGGTYTVQSNINGGGWNTMVTINANSVTTNAANTNFTVALNYQVFRVNGATGTNRIWDAVVKNSTARNYVPVRLYNNAGYAYADMTNAASVTTNLFSAYSPDLIVLQDTGGAANLSGAKLLDTWIQTYAPSADVIYIGWMDTDTSIAVGNALIREFAFTNSPPRGFFDAAYHWQIGDTNALVAAGYLGSDLVHQSGDYMDYALFRGIFGYNQNTNGYALQNIRIASIVSPGPIITNGTTFASSISNNLTVAGSVASYGSGAGYAFTGRNNVGSFVLFSDTGINWRLYDQSGSFAWIAGTNTAGVLTMTFLGKLIGDGNGITNSAWTTTTNSTAPSDVATIQGWMNVTNNLGKLGKIPVYY